MFLGSYRKSETTSESKLVPRILGSGLRFTLRHHEGTEPKIFACVVTTGFWQVPGDPFEASAPYLDRTNKLV